MLQEKEIKTTKVTIQTHLPWANVSKLIQLLDDLEAQGQTEVTVGENPPTPTDNLTSTLLWGAVAALSAVFVYVVFFM